MRKPNAAYIAIAVGTSCMGAAQADILDNVYAGAGVGYASVQSPFTKAIAALNGSDSGNGKVATGRVFTGYNVNEYLAVELGFMQTGSISETESGAVNGVNVTGMASQKTNGFDYSVLLHPSANGWMNKLFGRVGGTHLRTTTSYNASGAGESINVSRDTRGSGWLAGVGYDYPVNKHLVLRGELSYYGKISGKSSAHATVLGLNLIGRF